MYMSSITKVAELLGYDSTVGLATNVVEAALVAAYSSIESRMDTVFLYADMTDIFRCQEDRASEAKPVELRLSRCFLDRDAELFVYVDSDNLRGDEVDQDTLLDSSYYTVDYEKGVVSVIRGPVRNDYIRVDYSCGFDSNDDDTALDEELVPQWLSDLAAMQAVKTMRTTPIQFTNSRSTYPQYTVLNIETLMAPLKNRAVRPRYPTLHWPIYYAER